MKKTAKAHVNIALLKYWGKKDKTWNLPLTSSISFTVDKFFTKTTVEYVPILMEDHLYIDDKFITGEPYLRVKNFMDKIRALFNIPYYAQITSYNYVPYKAGLASSSSAFAALTLAATEAYGLQLSQQDLSTIARIGSGSAARSIHGGFVLWHEGNDHLSSYAETIDGFDEMVILVCLIDQNEKAISSRAAMNILDTYDDLKIAWKNQTYYLFDIMMDAFKHQDFELMGKTAEKHALYMHQIIEKSGITFLNDVSHEIIQLTQSLRKKGYQVYATMDAGANVKIITQTKYVQEVLPYYEKYGLVVTCNQGNGAHLL